MDLEANRMTSEWTLLLFSKIKKRYFLGTKIRKLKAKIKKMAIEKLNINEFFPIMSLEMVKRSE